MKTAAYMPFQVGARDRIVGFFVIGAVLLFLIGFVIPLIQRLGQEEGLPFYTVLDQTYGIAREATVTMRGVPIGTVTDVAITTRGLVRVDVSLSPAYQQFYTNGSHMTVDTNISASTILTGSGLVLHPAGDEHGVMQPGDSIPTEAPRGIASFLEEIDIIQLTDQVTEIVTNVEEITTGINQNQEKIYRSLDNLETVTASLAEVSESLPGMVNAVDESLVSVQNSLAGVDRMLQNTDEDLQQALANTVDLTEQATSTLAEAEVLMRATTPVLKQLPTVMITTDVALQSITRLTDQMSRSWLFGGGAEDEQVIVPAGPTPHPHDDTLYEALHEN